jgi:hypothetical protein
LLLALHKKHHFTLHFFAIVSSSNINDVSTV